jgi:hypothetical protein
MQSALSKRHRRRTPKAAEHARLYDEVSRDLVALERRIAVDLRNAGRISDDALRRVLYELDLDEARMTAAGFEA